MRTLPALLICTGLVASACGKKPGAYETLAKDDSTAKAADAELAAAEGLWNKRGDATQLEKAITAYEALATARPNDRAILTRTTRAWYFLADAHTTDKSLKKERYLKAIEWGKRCMAVNTEFARMVNEENAKESEAAAVLKVEDVPCMYWTASALGRWAKASGISKSIRHLPTVKAYIGKAEELQPTYFHHGPWRYWGAYYSVVPSFAGRDLTKSGEYFEKSIAGSPGYLGSYVLRAENLAVNNQDVRMFDENLKTVLAFDLNTVPELRPENAAEQAKAKALMAERGELFDKKSLQAVDGE
ncbi:MAG: TRAP transporter TatT component family protein [Myxococcota bacterium]